jgi:glycosyltransferase involved in cell wall biosynthesis
VHGHSAGGTNPSLVEAMYLGLPVLCYDVDYNRETTHQQAIYFRDEGDLTQLLQNLKREDLNLLAKKMKQIAHTHYVWENISKKYSELFHYQWANRT